MLPVPPDALELPVVSLPPLFELFFGFLEDFEDPVCEVELALPDELLGSVEVPDPVELLFWPLLCEPEIFPSWFRLAEFPVLPVEPWFVGVCEACAA